MLTLYVCLVYHVPFMLISACLTFFYSFLFFRAVLKLMIKKSSVLKVGLWQKKLFSYNLRHPCKNLFKRAISHDPQDVFFRKRENKKKRARIIFNV